MGRRGPAPLPTALHAIRGTKSRLRARHEAAPQVEAPACPRFLDEEARREWRRVVRELVRLRLLAKLDRAALTSYCIAWSRLKASEEAIAAQGAVTLTPNGFLQKNPHVTIANEAMRTMDRAAHHFGMSPSSRTRVNAIEESEPDDPFDEFIRAGA